MQWLHLSLYWQPLLSSCGPGEESLLYYSTFIKGGLFKSPLCISFCFHRAAKRRRSRGLSSWKCHMCTYWICRCGCFSPWCDYETYIWGFIAPRGLFNVGGGWSDLRLQVATTPERTSWFVQLGIQTCYVRLLIERTVPQTTPQVAGVQEMPTHLMDVVGVHLVWTPVIHTEAISKRLLWRRMLLFAYTAASPKAFLFYFIFWYFCSPRKFASHICSPERRDYWFQAAK